MTRYIVLKLAHVDLERWEVGVTIEAHSAADAIRSGAAGTERVYLAVPARSWNPTRVTVETTTKVHLASESS